MVGSTVSVLFVVARAGMPAPPRWHRWLATPIALTVMAVVVGGLGYLYWEASFPPAPLGPALGLGAALQPVSPAYYAATAQPCCALLLGCPAAAAAASTSSVGFGAKFSCGGNGFGLRSAATGALLTTCAEITGVVLSK